MLKILLKQNHALLFFAAMFFSSIAAMAQPTAVPAAGFEWKMDGVVQTYESVARSTMPVNDGFSGDTSYDFNAGETSSPYIQAQVFGDYGSNDNAGSPMDTPNSGGQSVNLNCDNESPATGFSGTTKNANFPNMACQTRSVSVPDWDNPNPDSGVSDGATTGMVCLQTSASLKVLMSPTPGAPGTGLGGDENYFDIIGGLSGPQSEFCVTVDDDMEWSSPTFASAMGAHNPASYTGTITANDAGPGGFYRVPDGGGLATWCNCTGFGETIAADECYAVTSQEDGSDVTMDFTACSEITISRKSGEADGRASHGPGMEGRIQMVVQYQCWVLCAIVPVEMTYFTAKHMSEKETVMLEWATESELDNSHFEVEHSLDSKAWTAIGKVEGHGTTAEAHVYGFEYENNKAGTHFYRLKQVDIAGTFEYSAIQSIEIGRAEKWDFFPNPINDKLTIQTTTEGEFIISVYDSKGSLVKSIAVNTTEDSAIELDLEAFTSGLYFINVYTVGGKGLISQQIIKQ